MNTTPYPKLVERVSKRIRPLLAGHTPQVQGAVLADLVSVFIAGHHPAMREEVLAMHLDLVRKLVPETEKEIFPDGLPEGWDKP
jgi:hypothetical protein